MAKKKRTEQQIVDEANELARMFYLEMSYRAPEGFRFDRSRHPQEQAMWRLACVAFNRLQATDPADALSNVEDAA